MNDLAHTQQAMYGVGSPREMRDRDHLGSNGGQDVGITVVLIDGEKGNAGTKKTYAYDMGSCYRGLVRFNTCLKCYCSKNE